MKNVAFATVIVALTCFPVEVGMAFPLGILLCNPGALRHTHDHWHGQTRLQTDKRFVRFDSPVMGERALMKVLHTYFKDHDLYTVSGIIYRWAPPTENNTELYVSDIARRMGVKSNDYLDLGNIDTLIKLAKAITTLENGFPPDNLPATWYTEAVYHEAAMMVLNGE